MTDLNWQYKKVKKAKKKSRSRSPIPLPPVAEDHEDHENEGSRSPGSSRSRSASIEEGELSEEELEQKRMALLKQLEASNDWKSSFQLLESHDFVIYSPLPRVAAVTAPKVEFIQTVLIIAKMNTTLQFMFSSIDSTYNIF